jgi:hypothetical protein
MFLDWTSFLRECDLNYFQNFLFQLFSCYLLYFSVFYIPTKIITIRNNDRPWFNNEIRKEIRIKDRFRKTVLKFNRKRDIKLYKKQRNKVNNMKIIGKENFVYNFTYGYKNLIYYIISFYIKVWKRHVLLLQLHHWLAVSEK